MLYAIACQAHVDAFIIAGICEDLRILPTCSLLDVLIEPIVQRICFPLIHGVSSVWPLSQVSYETLKQHSVPVSRVMSYPVCMSSDIAEPDKPLSSSPFLHMLEHAQLGACIIAPPVSLLNLALPIDTRYAGVVCAFVPRTYLSSAHSGRKAWLSQLKQPGRLATWTAATLEYAGVQG